MQTVTNQMHLIIPDGAVMLVTETPGIAAPPVALVVTDRSFVEDHKGALSKQPVTHSPLSRYT